MRIERVAEIVGDLPHMSPTQAERMTEHILEHRPTNVLELGFRHGVSTCFIAAALDELGGDRHVTTIDLNLARDEEPNVEQLLDEVGLRHRVTVHYEPTSYTWRLMRMLESKVRPSFDLCYLDGADNWFVDGFAFLLVDRLLAADGWIILDDLDWTYATSPSLAAQTEGMPEEERETAQIRKVWELLVKTHPGFSDFMEEDGWAFARKLSDFEDRSVAVEYVREHYGLGRYLHEQTKRGRGWWRRRRAVRRE